MVSTLHDHTILQIYTCAAKNTPLGRELINIWALNSVKLLPGYILLLGRANEQANKHTYIYIYIYIHTQSCIYIYIYKCMYVYVQTASNFQARELRETWTSTSPLSLPSSYGRWNVKTLGQPCVVFLTVVGACEKCSVLNKERALAMLLQIKNTTEICQQKFCKKYAASIVLCTRTMYRTVEKFWITYSVPNEKKIRKLYMFN